MVVSQLIYMRLTQNYTGILQVIIMKFDEKTTGKNNKTNPNMILPNPNMSKKGSCQNRPKTCLDITQ